MENKQNIGLMALPEDKEIIVKAARLQRRSVASFVVEASLIKAKEIIKQMEDSQ